MEHINIFSCKGKSQKEALALQILGYSCISVFSEKFEQIPNISIEAFKTSEQNSLQDIVKSVNISPQIWEAVGSEAPVAEIFFEKLLEMDSVILSEADFDNFLEKILVALNETDESFRIIDYLLASEEGLSKEREDEILDLLAIEEKPLQQQQQQEKSNTIRISRSKTLRLTGRRALTPMRRRHKKVSS